MVQYNYFSVDLAHHKIFHAKVGKGGIKVEIEWQSLGFSALC